MNTTTIIRTRVPEHQRLGFLPRRVPRGMLDYRPGAGRINFEFMVYDIARRWCREYTGGHWLFYRLSNGAWYMAMDEGRMFPCSNPDNFSDTVTLNGDSFGIALTMMVCSALSFHENGSELMATNYHALRDYIDGRPDALAILNLLD